MLRKLFLRKMLVLSALFLLMSVSCNAHADPAKDLSVRTVVTDTQNTAWLPTLFDGKLTKPASLADGTYFRMEDSEGIGSLYFVFDREYGSVQIANEATGETVHVDTAGRIHFYLDVENCFSMAPAAVTVTLESGEAKLNELCVFGPGEVPGWVQKWDLPVQKADLVLFSTHGDDEQLFFAGILPYYAGELERNVQVVYMTDHMNYGTTRMHEMLNGLWAVGVKTYPVFGKFPDLYSENLKDAYNGFRNNGYTDEIMLGYVVEQIRRFQPDVAIGHDINGEYGHGMHMLYTDLLRKAVEISNDPQQYPDSAAAFGTWDIPKTYLHLYGENKIVMDWDQPLENFNGMTAYQVTRDLGFPCFASQIENYRWYYWGADTAAQVARYSPREFGLYRSTVGSDVACNDFFENLTAKEPESVMETVEAPTDAPVTEPMQQIEIQVTEQAQIPSTEAAIPEIVTTPQQEPVSRQERIQSGLETDWIVIPGFGAVALTVLASVISALNRKKKY